MPTTAPTRDMRIAYAALRRDLARARWILSGPYGRRRLTAVGRPLARVADEVHHHHTGEDEVMWPELLRREPSLGALHERMSADHEAVHAPLDRLREVGLGLAAGTASGRHMRLVASGSTALSTGAAPAVVVPGREPAARRLTERGREPAARRLTERERDLLRSRWSARPAPGARTHAPRGSRSERS